MRRFSLGLIAFVLVCTTATLRAVEPISESAQAALALKLIDAYHNPRPATPPKKLHLVYFTPADRDPVPNFRERLEAIMEDIRAFYRDGMERNGFGPKTFDMERDKDGKLVFYVVKGREPASGYPRTMKDRMAGDPVVGGKVNAECEPVLKAAGISLDTETVLIFCNLADWNEKKRTFRHHSPYAGGWTQQSGLCWAVDSPILDLDLIPKKSPIINDGEYGDMSLGKHATIFIGGIAHELGHAFALPHCGERWDEKSLGTSVMGFGNHTYHDERRGEDAGSFLTMASAMRLASRPLFNGSDKGMIDRAHIEECDVTLSTNVTRADLAGRQGAMRVEGTVKGSPPIYGVVSYFDSVHDGGYHSPTATSVPDEQGRFAVEVSDLASCKKGDLRIEFCHVNGAVSQAHLTFAVTPEHSVDLSQWESRSAIEAVARAVAHNQRDAAGKALEALEKSNASELTKTIASKLVLTMDDSPKSTPADFPAQVTELALGDAKADSAEVGWMKPAANRIPENDQIESPLLDCGKIYATGLFAHAPSSYVFDLGGKWKRLSGEAGLHTQQQLYGTVVFIIKTDGREAYRSPVIHGAKTASYDIDLTGVKKLELIVDPTSDGNHNDWGLWLDPTLHRDAQNH